MNVKQYAVCSLSLPSTLKVKNSKKKKKKSSHAMRSVCPPVVQLHPSHGA